MSTKIHPFCPRDVCHPSKQTIGTYSLLSWYTYCAFFVTRAWTKLVYVTKFLLNIGKRAAWPSPTEISFFHVFSWGKFIESAFVQYLALVAYLHYTYLMLVDLVSWNQMPVVWIYEFAFYMVYEQYNVILIGCANQKILKKSFE